MTKQTESIRKTYDQTPYQSRPFPQSAPERLQAIAHIFGVDAPAASTARVLELGCSAGGNLIAVAVRHPKLRAMGVDVSGVQIAYGQQVLQSSGISNAELRQASIEEIDESWGIFDYIICHGVYSWVPEHVRNAILRVCQQRLSSNGVAYISYNTYPGWKSREILRDAMLLRRPEDDTPENQLAYARGMLDFLQQHTPQDSMLKAALDENMAYIRTAPPSYLLHEFLEQHNAPCYFKDFLASAAEHGLSYLAEADLTCMFANNYPSEMAQPLLRECKTQVQFEQYLDFVGNRSFRQTLLIKAEQASQVQYTLQRARLQAMHFAGWFEPIAQAGKSKASRKTEMHAQGINGGTVQLTGAVAVALAKILHKTYPATRTMPDLAFAIVAQTDLPVATVTEEVAKTLTQLLISGQVWARCQPVLLPKADKQRPKRVPGVHVWKLQNTLGQAEPAIMACSLWHEAVVLDSLEQQLWQHADGTRDIAALTQIVADAARAGSVGFTEQNQLVTDAQQQQELAAQHTPQAVARMRRCGLLA